MRIQRNVNGITSRTQHSNTKKARNIKRKNR